MTEVLVVGAGPTGLTMALDLARRGINVRIIDKNAKGSDKSKALGVQAGTLECFEQCFGKDFVNKMISLGQPAPGAHIHINQKDPIWVDFKSIRSVYNFILILEQSETERLLEEELKKHSVLVERNSELISIKNSDNEVHSEIKSKQGTTESLKTQFVVGCDGAHSAVRHQLQFSFDGNAYTGDFILADVDIEWPWTYDCIRTFVSTHGAMVFFPMKGYRKYRIVVVQRETTPDNSTHIEFLELKSLIQKMGPPGVILHKHHWLTRFRVHHRMTQHFQKGRVFLAGDAAHIHSPAGGQGMNIGMQDALNLSYKMEKVLRQNAPLQLLENYEKERIPVAKAVLRGTDMAFKAALLKDTFLTRFVRSQIVPIFVRSSYVQRKVVSAISEVKVARQEIARWQTTSTASSIHQP